MRIFSYRKRPPHLGPFPLERLPRSNQLLDRPLVEEYSVESPDKHETALGNAIDEYRDLLSALRHGDVAESKAPIPDSPKTLSHHIKAAAYFIDASMVGVCEIPSHGRRPSLPEDHRFAVTIIVEHARRAEPMSLAASWAEGLRGEQAELRALEIADVIAGYIRNLGYSASAHTAASESVRIDALLLASGLAEARGGRLSNPFLAEQFTSATVTTGLSLAPDRALAGHVSRRFPGGLAFLVGHGGTTSRLERWRTRRRATDASRFPMETVRRVDTTTTLVLDAEIPRVPRRAGFFERARKGDLGDKALRESRRFAIKNPLTQAMVPLMRAMKPLQDGAPQAQTRAASQAPTPAEYTSAIKSTAYSLGANLVGICETRPFCWYSHDSKGAPIEAAHRYAIVLLIDQGHETMEGASGDDWMSGAQSMRAYMRGALISGVLASHIRRLGFPARAHTNADSQVLHIPLVLLAGLGELSRIGELVLNPFLGPRFKTAVVTTEMPLVPDRPIDFGLQDMCSKCLKCARECPCSAISFGDKVMFNGYEMWKPDVERCTSYRVTNPHGSACGRCMKMCPYTNEGLLVHRSVLRMAMAWPWARRGLARLDDVIGNGRRNLIKKWWFDLEWSDKGRAVTPSGVNERDLTRMPQDRLDRLRDRHRIAYYPAEVMPAADDPNPAPLDRRRALAAAQELETPADARRRESTTPRAPRETQE